MTRPRTSVMDSLRWHNTDIPYDYDSDGGNPSFTRNVNYFRPYKLREWAEFTFDNLNAIEGGRMFQVASETSSLAATYPDDVEYPSGRTEATVGFAIQATAFQIVQKALKAVAGTLPSCEWHTEVYSKRNSKRRRRNNITRIRDSQRSTPALNHESSSVTSAPTPGRPAGGVLRPDGGARRPCREHNSRCPFSRTEILPKDYKSPTWSSKDAVDLLNEDGTWADPAGTQEHGWPIRQVYSYCVRWRCRYGCIITTRELFVFRIRPCTEEEGGPRPEGIEIQDETDNLFEALRLFGMMEYRSFKWNNSEATHRDDDEPMTMNMALWSLHILAAASHSTDWAYRRLSSETLPLSVCNSTVPATPVSDTSPLPGRRAGAESSSSSPLKRRREETEDTEDTEYTETFDGINHSFNYRASPIPRQLATPRSLRRRLRSMTSEAPDDCENATGTADHDDGPQGDTQPGDNEEQAPRRSASKRRRHLSSV